MITDWTDTRVERMKELLADKQSAAQIAYTLNRETGTDFTRNSVIGKLHRIGLRGFRNPPKPRRQKLTRMVFGKGKSGSWRNGPSLPAEPIPAPVIFTDEHKCALFDLKNNSCRFPLWDGDTPFHDKFFCGVPEADFDDGRSWCHFHSAVACRPVPVREAAE